MEGTLVDCDAEAALTLLTSAVDALASLDLARVPEAELVPLLIAVETQTRRLPSFDHGLLAELGARYVPGVYGYSDVRSLLVAALRVTPGEAKARVLTARDIGPKRTLAGEMRAPTFPVVAAAQAAGEISPEHARVVVRTIDRIPASRSEHEAGVEQVLVAAARELGPKQVAQLGDRTLALSNPDGVEPRDADHQHRRELNLTTATDGMTRLSGWLTPAAAAAVVTTVLDSLSQPVPDTLDQDSTILVRDQRTPGQRRHDALQDACERLLRDGDLPRSGGVPVSLVIMMTREQYATGQGGYPTGRRGYATTGHGDLISVPEALNLADQTIITTVVLDATGGIMNYGTTKRCLTEQQRRALTARDRGCSFPDCSVKPTWCEAHHVIEHQHGGPTSLDNSAMLCRFHHRMYKALGWQCHMLNGVPHWIPPAHLDPQRKPRRNRANHPVAVTDPRPEPRPV